ncbi:hypothetical protein [Corynebacterium glyciniphilum]|uniref:hypothetical protein n=1 Tax=Corynebacterium glyciniphilum TaxID=1404244 RepID=UPI003DA06EB2
MSFHDVQQSQRFNYKMIENLTDADRAATRRALLDAMPKMEESGWLPSENYYADDADKTLRQDKDETPPIAEPTDLAEYIAASSLFHMVDGWAYLRNSLIAIASGDRSVAYHLGYYAELRAAMSLLAASGIGIINGKNYVIKSDGQAAPAGSKNSSTHDFTWFALSWWADQQSSADLLGEVFKIEGRSLNEILNSIPAIASPAQATRSIIEKLSLDLEHGRTDSLMRNRSSYEPSSVVRDSGATPREFSQFITKLWDIIQPISFGYGGLAIEILSSIIRDSIGEGSEIDVEDEDFLEEGLGLDNNAGFFGDQPSTGIDICLNNLFENESTRSRIRIARGHAVPESIFDTASRVSAHPSKETQLEVVSRAALLLTISTLSCNGLLSGDSGSREIGIKWWDIYSANHGISENLDYSGSTLDVEEKADLLRDVWEEIQDSVNCISEFTERDNELVRIEFLRSLSAEIRNSTIFDVAAFWGMTA